MKLLSNKSLQQVSGGNSSKEDYDSHTYFWGLIGMCTAAASLSSIPASYREYFAVRLAAVGAGSLVGYAFGAAEYAVSHHIQSSVDYYLAPKR